MIAQIVKFLKSYIKGEEAELKLAIEFSWTEVAFILVIIILTIRLIWFR